jgi:long-chain acyl-CoA synthetase
VNRQLASYETIKRFRVLPAQFSIGSGELTPTLKLKRKVISEKFAREIDELFGRG